MKAIVQRVTHATVRVQDQLVSQIGPGLLVFLGLGQADTAADSAWMIRKLLGLRIFPDPAGKMNRSVTDTGGELLVVSQFTLYGAVANGFRPSFSSAMPPAAAVLFYHQFLQQLRAATALRVAEGQFAAHMQVELVNDGPVTILLESPAGSGTAEHSTPC